MRPHKILIGIIAGIALAVGLFAARSTLQPAEPLAARVIPAGKLLAPVSLVDHRGVAIDETFLNGQWNLVFFGFTQCPDICPLTLHTLSRAVAALDESVSAPRIVLVSVDPERDTPDILEAYVSGFGSNISGITGTLDNIKALTADLGIFFEKRPREDGDYTVDHSAVVLLFAPNGEMHAIFRAPHTVENYVHDLPILMSQFDMPQPPMLVSNLEVTTTGTNMRAAYFDIRNNSNKAVTLTRVSSPQFDTVAMHQTIIENDIARMLPIPEIVLKAGETVRFERGGRHLMLSGAQQNTESVTLNFFSGQMQLLSVTTDI